MEKREKPPVFFPKACLSNQASGCKVWVSGELKAVHFVLKCLIQRVYRCNPSITARKKWGGKLVGIVGIGMG